TASCRETRHPLQAEILDRADVDQFQRAETLSTQVSRVAGPLIRQRLDDFSGIETAGLSARLRLSVQKRGSNHQRRNNHEFFHGYRALFRVYPCSSVALLDRPQICGDVVHLLV